MTVSMKAIKDLGWNHISLSKSGFNGAVVDYKNTSGQTVAVGFNMHEAFVIEDSQGLFTSKDIEGGIIKSKDFDVEKSGQIEGLTLIGWQDHEDASEYGFDEEKLKELGLDTFDVRESIKSRIAHLSELDVLVDMKLE